MNADYISRALCFHGQPMQKIWEDERGAGDLQTWGVAPHPNYFIYQERQKHFTFQDRAKRFKLHQFFARKAGELYDKSLSAGVPVNTSDTAKVEEDDRTATVKTPIAVLPPYEVFVNKNQDRTRRWRCVLEAIKPGDIIFGVITKGSAVLTAPLVVKPLCTAEPLVRYLSDIPTKVYAQAPNVSKLPLDKRGKPRGFATNDYVCCEVLEISVDADRLTLGMDGVLTKDKDIKLGLVNQNELPLYYRKMTEHVYDKYEDYLLNAKEMLNPNYDMLYEINGLDVNDTFSLMCAFKYPFPHDQYARELRQAQASKWAFRAVAEGIEHFKIGNHVEAFQCLNKALNIDPRNVEGLVARGALYANKGSFLKAVEDFEKALKLNSYHMNARKYMGETLVALGRSYEDDNRWKDAAKAYKDCLNIIPNHEQARLSLEAIQQRPGSQLFDLFNITGASDTGKRKKKKRSDSSASTSNESSTGSSSAGSESDSSGSPHTNNKEASLSPLSKRMSLHAATMEVPQANQFKEPFYASGYNSMPPTIATVARNPNEFKLDDDDTETRVRKLLQEASKHKKEKVKKSKKKKSKKSKKDSHKSKEAGVATTLLGKIDFEEAYKAISGFGFETKLNKNLQMYEDSIAKIKKRQEVLRQSISSSVLPAAAGRERSETPPPPPMKIQHNPYVGSGKTTATSYAFGSSSGASTSAAAAAATASGAEKQPKLSFQIRRPVKVDKFGLVRIATPLAGQKSPSVSPVRRSRSRGRRDYSPRKRSRSPAAGGYSRSWRSRSKSRRRHRRSHSRSRSRSRSRHNNSRRRRSTEGRGGGGARGRRRSPSPFVPRDTPPPDRRRRSNTRTLPPRIERSRSQRSSAERNRPKFGNRVWQRPGYAPPGANGNGSASDDRWPHDKFDDGPSIEEIDEIINKAQKERKQEIISRDKHILKKPGASF